MAGMTERGASAQQRLTEARATAADGIRMYRGTALLLAATAAVALAAVLPVAALAGYGNAGIASRLGIGSAHGGDGGLPWTTAIQTPDDVRTGAVGFFFNLLLTSSAASLVIAGLSLLTVSGARALAREGEVAVRRAVGASRRVLTLSALLEGCSIAAGAVLIGGAAGWAGVHLAARSWPGTIGSGSPGVAIVAVAAVSVLVLAGALLPVVFARRQPIGEEEAKPLALFGPTLLQLGASLIVLATGALLTRHGTRAAAPVADRHDPVYQLEAPAESLAARARGYEQLLAELARHPELGTISLTSAGAITGLGTVAHVTTDCGLCAEGGLPIRWHKPIVVHQFVSADSFQALGIPLLAGRGIATIDRWGTEKVAVVSRSLAHDHFQSGEALGRSLQVADDQDDWYTVVGVVDDVVPTGFGGASEPRYAVYLSILQHPAERTDLLLRAPKSGLPAAQERALVAHAIAGRASSADAVPEARLLAAELAPLDWFGRGLRYQGFAMLAIAAAGLFTLMRVWVRSAWLEFGLRRAVGAHRHQVLAIILLRAAMVGGGGLLLGLWFGPAVWSSLPDQITDLSAWDGGAMIPSATVLLVVTLAGAVEPARTALRATPHTLLSSTGE
jgi:hypothetical protein